MSSHQYPPSDHRSSHSRSTSTSYHSIQPVRNPSQPSFVPNFSPYDQLPAEQHIFHSSSQGMPFTFPPPGRGPPSTSSSPTMSHRPTPSPGLQSTFVLPQQQQTISPTALYHHQAPPADQSHSIPQGIHRSLNPSPNSTAYPSYYDTSNVHHDQQQQEYLLPTPHAPRPHLTLSVSRESLPSGIVGDPEGWNGEPEPTSATGDRPSNPSLSTRTRTVSLNNRKKTSPQASSSSALPPRKRSPASCAPCRKKKLKCDRCLPCSSCVAKGSECVWEGDATPLFIKDELDQQNAKELRAQVDRLQSLVDSLTASPKSVKPSLRSAYGVSDSTDGPPSDLLPTFDLLAHDLTQALVELAFETVLPRQRVGELSFSPRGQNGDTFLEEARQYCQSRSKPSPLVPISLITPSSSSSEASPSSSAFPSHRPNALTTSSFLLRRQSNGGSFLDSLPSTHEMMLASNHYFSIYESSSFVVHHSSYEQQRERLKRGVEDNVELDPSSASIVVAIAAAGLSRMSDRQYKEMGLSGDRTSNVKQWLDVALSALSFAQFPERPTLDGIRTCLVVASVQLSVSKDYSSAFSLLSLATQSAFALELHRDPTRNGRANLNFFECQDRRRLFWLLFSTCTSLTTETSRLWPQFDLRQIDTQFPLDCFDEELLTMDELAVRASVRAREHSETFEETPLTLVLCQFKLALLSKKISDTAFAVAGSRYPDVIALDLDLRKMERSIPERYRLRFDDDQRIYFTPQPNSGTDLRASLLHLSISAEIVRLNRPFLILGASDETYQHSRERVVKHAKRILSIASDPIMKSWASDLTSKVLSAAVVLALESLQAPDEADAEMLKSLIANAETMLGARQAQLSVFHRQSTMLVQFLRKQILEVGPSQSVNHRAKRARTRRYSPDDEQVLSRQFNDQRDWTRNATSSNFTSRAGSPDSDSEIVNLRRKAKRPTLKHSARSESHIATRAARFAAAPPPPILERAHRSHSADELPTMSSLPLSPSHSATSAPSVFPVSFVNAPLTHRNRTISDPATAFQLPIIPSGSFPPPPSTIFRHYQPPSTRNSSFSPTFDSGFAINELSQQGGHLSSSSIYEDSDLTSLVEERMELNEQSRTSRFSEAIDGDYSFAASYRHS